MIFRSKDRIWFEGVKYAEEVHKSLKSINHTIIEIDPENLADYVSDYFIKGVNDYLDYAIENYPMRS